MGLSNAPATQTFSEIPAMANRAPRNPYVSNNSLNIGGNTKVPVPTPLSAIPLATALLFWKYCPICAILTKKDIAHPDP